MRTLPFLLRLTPKLLVGFALLIVVGRLLPQGGGDEVAYQHLFMTSIVCETPCLMGIRLGMPLNEAIQVLSQHEWVRTVSLPGIAEPRYADNEVWVHWLWNGEQPDFINADSPGFLYAQQQRVFRIEIATRLHFEAVQSTMRSGWSSALYQQRSDRISYAASAYDSVTQYWTIIETQLSCPAHLTQYFRLTDTLLSQSLFPAIQTRVPPQALSALCRLEALG